MLLEHKNDTLTFTEKMSAVKAAIFLSDMDMLNWNQECLFVCFLKLNCQLLQRWDSEQHSWGALLPAVFPFWVVILVSTVSLCLCAAWYCPVVS